MADGTKIEWADATVNAINGCSVTSTGCTHCYAMKLAGTRMKNHPTREGLTIDTKAGPVWNGEVRLHEPALLQPLSWTKPRRIFWNAHGDTFHENVPDEWIDRIFAVAALTPQHTHMILTKRSARMREYMTAFVRGARSVLDAARSMGRLEDACDVLRAAGEAYSACTSVGPLPNVWLGVSVEDQTRADERIPDLLATPAAIRFLSCEPLLGPVDLTDLTIRVRPGDQPCGLAGLDALTGVHWDANDTIPGIYGYPDPRIDWVIAGGESGPGARPMHPDWARSLRDQCAEAGVPFHFKQWGEFRPCEAIANGLGVDLVPPVSLRFLQRWRRWTGDESRLPHKDESAGEFLAPGLLAVPEGKKQAGRLLDGVEHNGFPQVQHG